MRLRCESLLAHPVDSVFRTYRDRLQEAAVYVPGIKEVRLEDSEDTDVGVRLHNLWVSDSAIPDFAQRFLKEEHLSWDDYANWFDEGRRCEWRLVVRAFPEAMRCIGTTRFLAGDTGGTRVVVAGELEFDLKKVRGVPNVMAGMIGPRLEKFLVARIQPNLERTNQAIGEFLTAEAEKARQ